VSQFRFISTRIIVTALTASATAAVAGVAFVSRPTPVQAFPAYAQKEAVHCAYCHNNPQGGGARNYRGKFYKKNSNSFAGFDDEAEAKAAGVPVAPEADPKPKSWTAPAAAPAAPTAPAAPAPAPAAPAKPSIDDLKKAVGETSAALKKAPKDPAAKKAHSASLTALAKGVMDNGDMPPAKRYPEALSLLRKAVALDPTNKEAASTKKMIEDVYKQMGKPLPKG